MEVVKTMIIIKKFINIIKAIKKDYKLELNMGN